MGHSISAAILRGPFNPDRAASFDLHPIPCSGDLTIFPLDPNYCDFWDNKLSITGFLSDRPLLDCNLVHHLMKEISDDPLFAVIETDYFGGQGDQSAAVYHGSTQIMAPEIAFRGPINSALKLLGVKSTLYRDAFERIGLAKFRDWEDLFDKYDFR